MTCNESDRPTLAIMKKLALSMIAALAIFSISCSNSDKNSDSESIAAKTEAPAATDNKAQCIAIMNEAQAAIEANPAELDKIMQEASQKIQALNVSPEEQQTLGADPEFMAAANALQMAINKASQVAAPADGTVAEESVSEEVVEDAPAAAATSVQK